MRLFLTACAIAAMGLFTACNDTSKNNYTLSGDAKGFEDQTPVFVLKIVDNQPQPVDTLQVQNEAFSGTFEAAEVGDIYILQLDGVPANVLFFPEDNDLHAVINKEEPAKSKMTGNSATESYYKYLKDISGINVQMADLNTKANTLLQTHDRESKEIQALTEQMMGYQELQMEVQKNFIKDNSNSIFSVILVQGLLQNQAIDAQEAEKMLSHLTPAIEKHAQTKKVREFIEQNKSNINEGSIAPDFSAKTPEGEELALYDVIKQGEYTLIDFWAAWCAPCRIENPNLVKLYEKYHDKGLEILGVSLDRTEEEWLGAIKKDKLTWHQISNLQFWNDPIAKEYKIQAIPASYIVDSNGKVIAKNLRGQQLQDFMEKLLGDK